MTKFQSNYRARAQVQGTLEISEVLGVFKRHAMLILGCALAGLVIAVAYIKYVPGVYVSRALLEIAPDASVSALSFESPDFKTIELKIATQALLADVAKTLDLASDPSFAPPRGRPYLEQEIIALLNNRISVNTLRGSRLISIEVGDDSAARAQQIARSLIEQLFENSMQERKLVSDFASESILAEIRRAELEVQKSEESLQTYRENYRVISLNDRQNIVAERLKDIAQRAAAAKYTRLSLHADWIQVAHLAHTNKEDLLGVKIIADNAEVSELRKQVAGQEAVIAGLAQRYGTLHPTLIQARSQLEEHRSAMSRAVQKSADSIRRAYENAKTTESTLDDVLAEEQKVALEIDRLNIPYRALERALAANTAIYQQALERLKQNGLSDALAQPQTVNGKSIRVVEAPMLPIARTKFSWKLILAFGFGAGFVIGCILAIVQNTLCNTISTTQSAESLLGLSVFTAIPQASAEMMRRWPVVLKDPASSQAEAIRSLRTQLSLLDYDIQNRWVLFTSAETGEGKTYCAINYAASLAQQGYRTLLIDGDLRSPRLQQLYGNPEAKFGLSDCLRDPDLCNEVPQSTIVDNLFILGDARRNPGAEALLSTDNLWQVLRRVYESYDRVVIDSAPIGRVSDALYIAKYVSSICVVIHAEKTPQKTVQYVCNQLKATARQANIGLVLNKTKSSREEDSPYGDEAKVLPELELRT